MVVAASPTDSRTNIWKLRFIELIDEDYVSDIYEFPDDCSEISLHPELMALPSAVLACKRRPTRHSTRSFQVLMPPEVARIYINEDGNIQFRDEPLDVYNPPLSIPDPAHLPSVPPPRSLSSLTKDAVITKFNAKLHNANSWLEIFESECRRLEVPVQRYWEVLRLFLEGPAELWYQTLRNNNHTLTDWSYFRNSFLRNFALRSWDTPFAAYSYRYISGSFVDYVHSKLHLLSSWNPNMHQADVIAHVMWGLPAHVQEKICPTDVDDVDELVAKVSNFEKRQARKSVPNSSSNNNSNNSNARFSTLHSSNSSSSSSPSAFNSLRRYCGYCKTKGFERYHKETECFTKFLDGQRNKSSNANNVKPPAKAPALYSFDTSSLEDAINNIQKNE